jgi:hypothetical protein
MQQKDTKSMSEVRLGGPSAVCTVCTVRTECEPVCTVAPVCTTEKSLMELNLEIACFMDEHNNRRRRVVDV